MAKISEVAELIMGQSPPSTTYNDEGDGLPFFQGKTDFGFLHPSPRLFCNAPLKVAKPGDILMSVRAPVGPTNISNCECCIGRGLSAIRPRGIDGEFLFFNLRFIEKIIASLGSGSTFQAINKTQLGSVEVNPQGFGLPEQRKIAQILGTVQLAIEQQERIIQKTTKLKKTLMQKLFTEGLRGEPQKQTEIGPVPESWEVVKLGDCCQVQTGIAKGRKIEKSKAIELPYLRVANVQAGYLDLREIKTITIHQNEKKRFLLCNGDIVLTEGGDFDKLGRGFIWKDEIKDCVHQNHIFVIRVDRSKLIPEFMAYLSQSPYGKSYFLLVAHKTTNLACINTTKLKGFPILIPPFNEQEDIVNLLEAVDLKISNHTAKKNTLLDLFTFLINQLMTGQILIKNYQFFNRNKH